MITNATHCQTLLGVIVSSSRTSIPTGGFQADSRCQSPLSQQRSDCSAAGNFRDVSRELGEGWSVDRGWIRNVWTVHRAWNNTHHATYWDRRINIQSAPSLASRDRQQRQFQSCILPCKSWNQQTGWDRNYRIWRQYFLNLWHRGRW